MALVMVSRSTKRKVVSDDIKRDPRYMSQRRALKSVTIAHKSQSLASFTTRLTAEQLAALRRCEKGISLRFEAWAIVNALVDGGYAEYGVAGVVTVTAKGKAYVRMHEPKGMP
jgi:hypothetical protein